MIFIQIKKIKVSDSLRGITIKITNINDSTYNLKIPKLTRHKTKMRIPKAGLSDMNGKTIGDLYVNIEVEMPEKLNENQKKTY